jgi:hypothetical protein
MKRIAFLVALSCFFTSCISQPSKVETTKADVPPPKLLAPSVRKIWLPPQLKDGGQEWEAGHYLYRIERNTSWSR